MRFGNGRELQVRPTISKDFHIEFAPARVRFELPPLLFQSHQNVTDKIESVRPDIAPIFDARGINALIFELNGFQTFVCGWRSWPDAEPALITRPATANRLQKKQER